MLTPPDLNDPKLLVGENALTLGRKPAQPAPLYRGHIILVIIGDNNGEQ